MEILDYSPALERPWREMFVAYFTEDSDLPAEIVEQKLCGFLLSQWEKGVLRIAVAQDDGVPMGFAIYQIDTPESDWCKRPGWGFIREFYILPGHRRRGYGTQLAQWTAQRLREMGAARLYLTADSAIAFWQRCGYTPEGSVHENGTIDMVQ